MRISDWSSDVCSSDLIGRLVGYMISNTMIQTRDYDHPLFYYEATMRTKALDLLTQLKRFIHARVIKSPQLQQTRFKGQQMIIQLFDYFHRDPQHLLPSSIGQPGRASCRERVGQAV